MLLDRCLCQQNRPLALSVLQLSRCRGISIYIRNAPASPGSSYLDRGPPTSYTVTSQSAHFDDVAIIVDQIDGHISTTAVILVLPLHQSPNYIPIASPVDREAAAAASQPPRHHRHHRHRRKSISDDSTSRLAGSQPIQPAPHLRHIPPTFE